MALSSSSGDHRPAIVMEVVASKWRLLIDALAIHVEITPSVSPLVNHLSRIVVGRRGGSLPSPIALGNAGWLLYLTFLL